AILPPFWAILPPFCHPIGWESGRGQPLYGTQAKRVATFALGTTVGPQPRPARSTPGEPGRAADRQVFASLSCPTDRPVVRHPLVVRPGFLVSTSRHPRTAVRRGRHDPDIPSLRCRIEQKDDPSQFLGSESQPSAPGLLLPPPPMGRLGSELTAVLLQAPAAGEEPSP